MARLKYVYDVYDKDKKKHIVVEGSLKDVTNITGMTAVKANQYAETGYVYKKRFIIRKKLINGASIEAISDETKPPWATFWTKELIEEWDRVRFMVNPNAKK